MEKHSLIGKLVFEFLAGRQVDWGFSLAGNDLLYCVLCRLSMKNHFLHDNDS
jgi:hypothetical protein